MNVVDLAILKKMIGGGSGTNNYNDLSNLPQINGETLTGNKTAANLGLQDALAFDSAPTEDSTNPVISGGVYSALTGKQDNLTFDGVYNASTNKAATESTVTNAIAGLDVSDFSVDADETISSISETDGKISVNKQDIAIASSQVVAMTGYAKPSSAPATPAIQQGDTANEAIGKLEYKADTNQTNILYGLEHGSKNQLNFDGFEQNGSGITWKINDDKTITATGTATSLSYITLTLNNNYAYADAFCDGLHYLSGCPTGGDFSTKYSLYLAKGAYNPVDTGEGVLIPTTSETDVRVVMKIASGFAIPSGGITFKPMICLKSVYDAYPEYQSYGAPNYDLTRLEAEDRASLAEVVDAGAKNQLKLNGTQSSVYGLTVTWDYNNGTVKVNGTVTGTTDPAAYIQLGSWTAPEDGYYKLYAENANSSNIYVYNDATWGTSPHSSAYDSVRYFSKGTTFSHIYLRVVNGYTVNNVTIKPMICTLADWKVSQKFVPYRPNWDLVSSATNIVENSLKPWANLKSGDNLDNIVSAMSDKGVYMMCAVGTNDVLNKPSNGIFYVRTWKGLDVGTAIQICTMLTDNNVGRSYIRTRASNIWSAWKETTNV